MLAIKKALRHVQGVTRRELLLSAAALALLSTTRIRAQAAWPSQTDDAYYSIYRRGLINRHICSNGLLLQQVWLVEGAPESAVDARWRALARDGSERSTDGGVGRVTAFPLAITARPADESAARPLVVGGGDNPLLDGGLALSVFSMEILVAPQPPNSARQWAAELFSFFEASEITDPNSGEPDGYLMRRRNWWSVPAHASFDEYCGVVLGTWFFNQAMDKIGDVQKADRARRYMGRLARALARDDYLVPTRPLPEYPGLIEHGQTGRDVWFLQFAFTRLFKSALGTPHLADKAIPDARAGDLGDAVGFVRGLLGLDWNIDLQPKEVFSTGLDNFHFFNDDGGQFYNSVMWVHGLLMLHVAEPNDDVREEIWSEARGFLANALQNGALKHPYFGLVWEAWGRQMGDSFGASARRRMWEPLATPSEQHFHDLPMREALEDFNGGRAIDVRGNDNRYLWGRHFLANAPWRLSREDFLRAGIVGDADADQLVENWAALAEADKDHYTMRSPLGSVAGEIGPPGAQVKPDRDVRRENIVRAFFEPEVDKGFRVEGSGLRFIFCRILAAYLDILPMPSIDETGLVGLPLAGPEPGAFRHSLSIEVKDVRRTISMVRGRFGEKGNVEFLYPRDSEGLRHFWRANDIPFEPLRHGGTFGAGTEWDAARVIQSNYGNNLEVVARNGERLYHFFREGNTWRGGWRFANDIRGVPGFVQSSFGDRGDFQVVVGHEDGGIVHLYRDNDDPGEPWRQAARFYQSDRRIDSVTLIQSNYGNLEIVFKHDDDLFFMWRRPSGEWTGARRIARNVRGTPAFLQSSGGTRGHFEVLVPDEGSGIRHIYRDNDDPSEPWRQRAHFARDLGDIDCVDAVETGSGHLDIVAITNGGRVTFHRRPIS